MGKKTNSEGKKKREFKVNCLRQLTPAPPPPQLFVRLWVCPYFLCFTKNRARDVVSYVREGLYL